MNEPLTCPRCGEAAILRPDGSVICKVSRHGWGYTMDDWNRRAPSPTLAALIQELEGQRERWNIVKNKTTSPLQEADFAIQAIDAALEAARKEGDA